MRRDEIIHEIVRRLVDHYHPVRIYLFGSAARGESGPDSDLDFLVVVPDETPDAAMRDAGVYTKLSGMGVSKDIIPWRESDFDARAAYVRASLPATVLRSGLLVYSAA